LVPDCYLSVREILVKKFTPHPGQTWKTYADVSTATFGGKPGQRFRSGAEDANIASDIGGGQDKRRFH
jgi:hypothetical protein